MLYLKGLILNRTRLTLQVRVAVYSYYYVCVFVFFCLFNCLLVFLFVNMCSIKEPYKITDDDPDPVFNWWIESLHLFISDKKVIANAGLTTAIIDAAQSLLSAQFPNVAGFQSTVYGQDLKYKPFSGQLPSVQLLNTGTQ